MIRKSPAAGMKFEHEIAPFKTTEAVIKAIEAAKKNVPKDYSNPKNINEEFRSFSMEHLTPCPRPAKIKHPAPVNDLTTGKPVSYEGLLEE